MAELTVTAEAIVRILSRTTPGPGGCVIWTAGTGGGGYGSIRVGGKNTPAHRTAYELLVGPVAAELQVDHLCHNRDASCPGGDGCLHRRCVNPYHLEPVTNAENARRSPHTVVGRNIRAEVCANGHPFDEANTYIRKDNGGRVCRACRRDNMRTYSAAARAASPADLPTCGHTSRDGNPCARTPGHPGKHQSLPRRSS